MLKGETPDYINASVAHVNLYNTLEYVKFCQQHLIPSLQGYKQQRAFIIAQNPMESTARDFWKVVHDRKCGVIVMFCQMTEAGNVGRL